MMMARPNYILPANSTTEDDRIHHITETVQQHIRPSSSTSSTSSTITKLIVDSFIPSILSYLACISMDTSPSYSILLYPLLQLGVAKLSTPLKKILSTTISMLGLTRPAPPTPDTVEKLTILVKQLVMDQHRTMFYTVTLSTTPSLPTYIPRRHTENLKWQYATSVCKSQAIIKRVTTNCPTYYSITFMEEIMEEEEDT